MVFLRLFLPLLLCFSLFTGTIYSKEKREASMIYFEAWTMINSAKSLEKTELEKSIEKYKKAKSLLDALQEHHYEWKTYLVSQKQKHIIDSLKKLGKPIIEDKSSSNLEKLASKNSKTKPSLQKEVKIGKYLANLRKTESENITLQEALKQSRSDYQKVLLENTQLQADLENIQEKNSKISENRKIEKNSFEKILLILRKKSFNLSKNLEEKNQALKQLEFKEREKTQKIEEAKKDLFQLKLQNDVLSAEYNDILNKLQKATEKNVIDLLTNNLNLEKKLNKTTKQIENSENQEKEETNSFFKQQVNILHQEVKVQQELLKEFKKILGETTHHSLSKQLSLKEEEIQILRGILHRQAKEHKLLVKTAENLNKQLKEEGISKPSILESVNNLLKNKFHLNENEKKILNPENAQESFIFTVATNMNRLLFSSKAEKAISSYEIAGKRAFESHRYQAAKELFEMIDEVHPNYIPALCNLGILNLKEKQFDEAVRYFRTALTMRHNEPFPYAQFMLGVSLYKANKLDSASLSFQKVLDLEKNNALTHLYLGSIAEKRGDFKKAKQHFTQAAKLDSSLSEPYFNLAVLEIYMGNTNEAKKFYQIALLKGANPNEKIEKLFNESKKVNVQISF